MSVHGIGTAIKAIEATKATRRLRLPSILARQAVFRRFCRFGRCLRPLVLSLTHPIATAAKRATAICRPSTSAIANRRPAAWGEAEAERAAIVEHDGNIPRAWAEGFARLHPDCPPADVPAKRWVRFVDDVGRFLDSPFCAVAAALGWGPLDLFGCDRERPFARIGQAGLLWLLNGDRLLALTENTATIAIKTGAQQTYRCKPSEPGRVLAWELAGGERR